MDISYRESSGSEPETADSSSEETVALKVYPKSSEHECNCLDQFALNWMQLYDTMEYADISLIIGSSQRRMKAHRIVLATQSDVMARMLYGDMQESRSDVIEFPTADEKVFPLLLKFMYTGTVLVPNNLGTVIKLSQLCDFFNVNSLKQKCGQWIKQNINETSVCACLGFLPILDETVHDQCRKLITNKTDVVLKSDSFKELSTSSLQLILHCNKLEVDEINLFEALQRWVGFQIQSGNNEVQASLPSLIQQIRLPLMTPQQLLGPVRASGMFSLEAITDALTHVHLPGTGTFKNDPRKIQRRRKIHNVRFVNSVGFAVQGDGNHARTVSGHSVFSKAISVEGGHDHTLGTDRSLPSGTTGVWVEMGKAGGPTSISMTFQLGQKYVKYHIKKPRGKSTFLNRPQFAQLPLAKFPITISLTSGNNAYVVRNTSSDNCVELELPEKQGFLFTVNIEDAPGHEDRRLNCQINDQFVVEDVAINEDLYLSITVSAANSGESFQLV